MKIASTNKRINISSTAFKKSKHEELEKKIYSLVVMKNKRISRRYKISSTALPHLKEKKFKKLSR